MAIRRPAKRANKKTYKVLTKIYSDYPELKPWFDEETGEPRLPVEEKPILSVWDPEHPYYPFWQSTEYPYVRATKVVRAFGPDRPIRVYGCTCINGCNGGSC